ncbi:hypothetical protein CEXT_600281 [Caerostris extrusa]|uniref:Ycf15 n=1 Tax=Caerostris extrusa TaxID=172846 RepID=A0AAV4Y578_CAEEX|nr:hypothetical protein CEXT_600281 [Caerostris extrusa]
MPSKHAFLFCIFRSLWRRQDRENLIYFARLITWRRETIFQLCARDMPSLPASKSNQENSLLQTPAHSETPDLRTLCLVVSNESRPGI